MKKRVMSIVHAGAMAGGVLLAGCASPYDNLPMVTFTASGTDLIAEGVIGSDAPDDFKKAVEANPEVTRLVLQWAPGSIDDDRNLELAAMVRARGMNTHIPSDALTASGGTDLFLSGVERTIGQGACIGVHTWGDDDLGMVGSEVPKDHPFHKLYLDYYAEMGIPGEFYWFTLDAAGPDDSHWMTSAELDRYSFTQLQMGTELDPAPTERCEQRYSESWEERF